MTKLEVWFRFRVFCCDETECMCDRLWHMVSDMLLTKLRLFEQRQDRIDPPEVDVY